jgi:hypothetical protein
MSGTRHLQRLVSRREAQARVGAPENNQENVLTKQSTDRSLLSDQNGLPTGRNPDRKKAK